MSLYVSRADDAPRYEFHDVAWWEMPYGRWRLLAESAAMRRFPEFELHLADDGRLAWWGLLASALTPESEYLVHVTYPQTFPDEAPTVTIEAPELDYGTPHLLSGQRPCLYLPTGPRQGYDPARTTAATLVGWTALWIHAYETWQATGCWPGAED